MLLLDAGNSRCKWALLRDGEWVQHGVCAHADILGLSHVLAEQSAPSHALISNVAGTLVEGHLRGLCAALGVIPEFIVAQPSQCGVKNGYLPPHQLGSDRWAALIAAWQRVRGACLVVHCGTATVVDALSCEGDFLGGLIMPGVDLMQHNLVAGTKQILSAFGHLCDFPLCTADAVYSGALRATLGAIEHQYKLLGKRIAEPACLLSGGAAGKIGPSLELPFEYVSELVLHGLQCIGENRK